MNRIFVLFYLLSVFSCKKQSVNQFDTKKKPQFISAVDISNYPEIQKTSPIFYDLKGKQKEFLNILKENGINTVRLRLWIRPIKKHSGFNEVKKFSLQLKDKGFKIWLTLHYSNTWADPLNQKMPRKWQGTGIDAVKDSVFKYTQKVVKNLDPDYIQVGNEINSGILHPHGNITKNYEGFIELIKMGILGVRTSSKKAKIILHFAGIENSKWFFNQIKTLDYDIIGLSYYPIWHGKDLNKLKSKMQYLSKTHQKKILIAETAYPFTLSWNDQTNNIVGLKEHLILPKYPATPKGQKNFLKEIKIILNEVDNAVGFCYWGAELIAWKGTSSSNASPWENQALFNFQNRALPALEEFKVK